MKKEIDLGKCFTDSWELYKNNLGILISSTLIAFLVGSLTCGVLYAPLFIGLFWIVDRLFKNDSEKPAAGDLFKGFSKFAPSLICFIIFAVIYAIACALPIVGPLVALAASPLMMYALMYIAYEDMDAIGAFKRVFQELFSGYLLMPVVIGFLAGLAGSVGGLLCGIGVIITAPITFVIYVCAYHQMKANSDIEDAEIVSEPKAVPEESPLAEIDSESAPDDAETVAEDKDPTAE